MKRLELFFTFVLVPLDTMMILLALGISYIGRSHLGDVPFFNAGGHLTYLRLVLYILPVWLIINSWNGLYSVKKNIGWFGELSKIMVSNTTAILLLIVLLFLSQSFFFSRFILILTWALSILLVCFGRVILRLIRNGLYRYNIGQRNLIIIGHNDTSNKVAALIKENIGWGYRLVGVVEDLKPSLKNNRIDEVILTDYKLSRDEMLRIVEICDNNGITFKYVPDIYSMMTSNFHQGLLGSVPVMEFNVIPLDGWGRIIKRILDLIFSLILLIILSPILLLLALLIKLSSRGPVIYASPRIGRDEKNFQFYKFRSMYIEKCDFKGGVNWTTADDEKSKVTWFGHILRKTNLDELPQLWSIFKGDMSFVGPRPEQPKLVEKFESDLPNYFRRHKIKTGLTVWAQVNGLKGDTSVAERVKYDIYYIENWSLWLDAKILIKTIGLVVYEAIFGKFEYRTRP